MNHASPKPHSAHPTPLPLVAGLALALLASGCATMSAPGPARAFAPRHLAEAPAARDASPVVRVAFHADRARGQERAHVPGGVVHAGDWLSHLTVDINDRLALDKRYDGRFGAPAASLLNPTLDGARYVYPDHADPLGVERKVWLSAARVVRLRVARVMPVVIAGEAGVRVVLEARIGQVRRQYAWAATGANADRACFLALGQQLLGDGELWNRLSDARLHEARSLARR